MPQITTQPLALQAIDKYLTFHNAWLARDGVKPATAEEFISGEYADSIIVHSSDSLLHLSIYNGDDGGSIQLICTISAGRITSITQVFDTIPTFIWSEDEGFIAMPDNDYRSN